MKSIGVNFFKLKSTSATWYWRYIFLTQTFFTRNEILESNCNYSIMTEYIVLSVIKRGTCSLCFGMTVFDSLKFFKKQRLKSFHECSLKSDRIESLSLRHPTSVESQPDARNSQKTTGERPARTSLARTLLALLLWHAVGAEILNNPSVHREISTKRYLTTCF